MRQICPSLANDNIPLNTLNTDLFDERACRNRKRKMQTTDFSLEGA